MQLARKLIQITFLSCLLVNQASANEDLRAAHEMVLKIENPAKRIRDLFGFPTRKSLAFRVSDSICNLYFKEHPVPYLICAEALRTNLKTDGAKNNPGKVLILYNKVCRNARFEPLMQSHLRSLLSMPDLSVHESFEEISGLASVYVFHTQTFEIYDLVRCDGQFRLLRRCTSTE